MKRPHSTFLEPSNEQVSPVIEYIKMSTICQILCHNYDYDLVRGYTPGITQDHPQGVVGYSHPLRKGALMNLPFETKPTSKTGSFTSVARTRLHFDRKC